MCVNRSGSSRFVNKHGFHRQFLFLIGRFLKIFSSVTACPNETKHGRKHLCKVLISASYQISVYLATRYLQRRFFFRNKKKKKNCLWWPCVLTDRDEMNNIYREPCIDASYQVLIHLAKRFQKRRLHQKLNHKCSQLVKNNASIFRHLGIKKTYLFPTIVLKWRWFFYKIYYVYVLGPHFNRWSDTEWTITLWCGYRYKHHICVVYPLHCIGPKT
jgi:hypothetical protein